MTNKCIHARKKRNIAKGCYEVLRAKKSKDTVIVFKKDNAKEHLSVQQKDYRLIRQFIRETKELVGE